MFVVSENSIAQDVFELTLKALYFPPDPPKVEPVKVVGVLYRTSLSM